jgi:hypothetical protein
VEIRETQERLLALLEVLGLEREVDTMLALEYT